MIFNLPNILAFLRILASPLMLLVMLNPTLLTHQGFHETWVLFTAASIFVVASITDFFDGYIARELNQITPLGKIIDPLADKMLTLAAFFGLMMMDIASVWAVYIIITRELFISGLRTVAAQQGMDVAASFSGKLKTVSQMVAIGFLLMSWPFAQVLLWISVALTVYSAVEYIIGFYKTSLEYKAA